jgi:transposase
MFLSATKSKRKGKVYVSWLVRESYRTADGPRSRTICNLTGLPDSIREMVAGALKGRSFCDSEQIHLASALDFGGLVVLRDAWDRFDMDRVLGEVQGRNRGLLQAMIFSRILFPCAKLDLAHQAQGTLLAQSCGLAQDETFQEDALYAAMDELNGRWVGVEKGLYQGAFTESVTLALYDLTSVYFEGQGPQSMAHYGYSRDHRGDRPQMILAVVTDREGTPIHLEVLKGNRADNSTLQGILETVRRRFGIKEATFVFDGGMSSRINLQMMDDAGLNYVTRLSSSSMQTLLKSLPEDNQVELGDRTRLLEVEHEGKRYVVAGGTWRQQRDRERRDTRIEKAKQALKKLCAVKRKNADAQKISSQVGRLLQRLKAHRYFNYRVDVQGTLQWSLKQDLIDQESKIDGWYLLHTNLTAEKQDAKAIFGHYRNLLDVEEAFCQIKSYMQVRPVYHYRDDRVRNHVRICFMAYWLSARLAREWKLLGEKTEVPRILQKLQTIRLGSIKLKNQTLPPQITQIPSDLHDLIVQLKINKLFDSSPRWFAPVGRKA